MSVSSIADRKLKATAEDLCILELDDTALPYVRAVTTPGRAERDAKQLHLDRLCLLNYERWVREGRETQWLKCPLEFLVAHDESEAENLRYRIRRSCELISRKDREVAPRFGKYKAFVDEDLLSILPEEQCMKLDMDDIIVAFTITDKTD